MVSRTIESVAFTVARIVAAFFLVWAFWPHSYRYFELLRLGVVAVCVFGIYCAAQWKQQGWIWVFGFIAVLFQPFIKIALGRQMWNYVDVIVAAFFVLSIFLLRDKGLMDEKGGALINPDKGTDKHRVGL